MLMKITSNVREARNGRIIVLRVNGYENASKVNSKHYLQCVKLISIRTDANLDL